jgi:DNA-binding CsgD family transcriptional regulator
MPSLGMDGALRDFARGLKSKTDIEEVGKALSALGALFAMPELMVANTEAAAASSPAAVLYSARSLSDLRAYEMERPFAANPLMRHSWNCEKPCSLSEMKDELKLSDEHLWSLLPPWTKGKQALAINVPCKLRGRINFWFGGPHAGVSGTARSVLFVAAGMAVEHIQGLEHGGARPNLSKREAEVLRLIAAGKADSDVGEALGIAARTVRFHLENAKQKLGVTTRAQAVLMVLRGEVA